MIECTPLHKQIDEYLTQQPLDYQYQIVEKIDDVQYCATPSFRTQRDIRMILPLPYAAHQEGSSLYETLQQYSRQSILPYYRIVAYGNHPKGTVDITRPYIERFINEHPEVPIGCFTAELSAPYTISDVRRLVSHVALAGVAAKGIAHDILVVPEDADIVDMHPDRLRLLDNLFQSKQPGLMAITSLARHAPLLDDKGRHRFPNMDIVIAWRELAIRLARRFYDFGQAFSARALLDVGDYVSSPLPGETVDVINRIVTAYPGKHIHLPQTLARVSSRGLYYKMTNSLLGRDGNFWPDPLSHTEIYRTLPFDRLLDIPDDMRDEFIRLTIDYTPRSIMQRMPSIYEDMGFTAEEASSRTVRATELGKLILKIAPQ